VLPKPDIGWTQGLFLSIFAIAIAWVAFICLHDEQLDKGFEDFYFKSRYRKPGGESVAIGLLGLSAPSGKNFMEHGRFVDRVLDETSGWEEAKKRIEADGKLDVVGPMDSLDCWLDLATDFSRATCASDERVRRLVRENAELLARYRSVYPLQYMDGGLRYNPQLLISLNKLVVADIRLETRRNSARRAYRKWRENHAFILQLGQSNGTWIETAILIVLGNLSIGALEPILRSDIRIVHDYGDELEEFIKPSDLPRYNLEGIMQAEYLLFDPVFTHRESLKFWVHPEFIRNRFYRYAQDFLQTARQPPNAIDSDMERLRVSHLEGWSVDYLKDPLNTLFVRAILSGQKKTGELLKQMYLQEGKTRLLALQTQILRTGLPDSAVDEFLRKSPSTLCNPFSREPMRWDPVDRSIYFGIPGVEGRSREVHL
jgi:hypothetical protein